MHFIDVNGPEHVDEYNNLIPKKHVIVLYYMDNCGFCDLLKPKWDRFEKRAKKNHKKDDDFVIARVNSNHIKGVDGDSDVIGYPTIMHLLDGKKHSEFNGERSEDALEEYLNTIKNKYSKSGGRKMKKGKMKNKSGGRKPKKNRKRSIKRKMKNKSGGRKSKKSNRRTKTHKR